MYTTLEEYKLITNTQDGEDGRINLALTLSQGILDGIIDNQESRQLTDTVRYSDIRACQFRSPVFNVQSIDEVN